MTPEQLARQNIDAMLTQAGWTIQNMNEFNPTASLGVAVREFITHSGPADYVLFVDGEPCGVIEAKKEGVVLTGKVEEQTEDYGKVGLKYSVEHVTLRFLYQSTGKETRFCDLNDTISRWRDVFYFHQPQALNNWLQANDTLRNRLQHFPVLPKNNLRDCQITAINNLEISFSANKPRALIQMATGAGKTFTAITFIYRLLKYANAKRVLFLVDTRNLGEQAEREFLAYQPHDDTRNFHQIYGVQRLQSSFVSPDNCVYISTIQRMYSILRGEELDEHAEDISLNELSQKNQRSKEVAYNQKLPIEFFDFVVIDECHRSIYNLWKQVLDYYDGFLIGLTATPDNRTFGFFNKNVVSEYRYEDSVIDGVNVPYDVYTIETEITKNGAIIKAGEWIDKRDRQSRSKTWEQLDEDEEYQSVRLDRDVVSPDQIRTIVRTFKEKLATEIFPGRKEVPKTLIFAKTDSHADDIIKTIREEFNEGNAFCKKVTYGNTEEKASEVLAQFRNEYNPRIAVTVDMIATGTDVKAIECLLFMRDVRSRSYFEQMKGRGTRTLNAEELQKRSPSAHTAKTHFVIVDAVGVCQSIKTDSRPLERQPNIGMHQLLLNVVMGAKDEDTLTTLANRLTKLEKNLTPKQKEEFAKLNNGKSINKTVRDLLESYSPDVKEEIQKKFVAANPNSSPDDREKEVTQKQKELIKEAVKPFNLPAVRNFIEQANKNLYQLIDVVNIDTVLRSEWDGQAKDKATALIMEFKEYLEQHKDEITALQLFYNQTYSNRRFTFKMIRELSEKLKQDKPVLAPSHIWQAYEQLEKVNGASPKSELVALVSLIRRVLEIDTVLTSLDVTINKNFQTWIFKQQAGATKYNEEQMEWLRLIKDHVATSLEVDKADLENTPFAERGGLSKFFKLFGSDYETLITELNNTLVA